MGFILLENRGPRLAADHDFLEKTRQRLGTVVVL